MKDSGYDLPGNDFPYPSAELPICLSQILSENELLLPFAKS